jgi:drug/metabolite transporter (DMT)-like permease
LASVLFAPTLVKTFKNNLFSRSDYFYLFLQALLGTVLYRVFFLAGLKYIDASFAGILSALQPAIISLLAFVFLREKQSSREKIGIVLAVFGLVLAYFSNDLALQISGSLLFGSIFILLAVFGEACFSVFAKKINTQASPMAISGVIALMSCLLFLPAAIYDALHFDILSISLFGVGLIVYYGLFLTYVSFILWFKGLQQVKVSVAGVFTALIPISGVSLSMILLNELPSYFELLGGLLIILSIILVTYKNEK